jgi:hypothetical protein
MEELIFITVPIFTALIAARIFRRKIGKIDVGVAIIASAVIWFFGPRCLCTDPGDRLVGAFLFAIVFGGGIFFLSLIACFGWKCIH